MRRPIALACLLASRVALAEPVAVEVTELAGGIAYITPGRAVGIVPGTKVKIRGRELVVVEVTEQTASVSVDASTLAVGDSGVADVSRDAAATQLKTRAKPRPAEAFAGQWREPVLPAAQQNPTPVSLGGRRQTGRGHVTVIGQAFGGWQRNGGGDGEASARVIASYDLMTERPLAADVDLAGRAFVGGYDAHTRTPLQVRVAQVRYGRADDPRFALGRLRFAASSVGMLDGARASAAFGSVQVAAFGGLVPDPLGGKPALDTARFGSELVYDDAAAAWRPRVAFAAYGSTYEGAVDERRASIVASASKDAVALDGWADAQMFSADNPWAARTVELTGAGAGVEWRKRGTHVGADLTFLRPERSLRLAALLPPEWLCTQTVAAGGAEEPCRGGDYTASIAGSAGMRTERWSIDAIGTAGRSHGIYEGFDGSAYLRGELRASGTRWIAGGSAGRASFASWTAAEVGAGAALARSLDASLTYRPELLDYVASTGPVLMHSLVLDAHYAVQAGLDLALSGVATRGSDRDALAALVTFVWRPLP